MQTMPGQPPLREEKRRVRGELRAFRRALDASALARAAEAVRTAARLLPAIAGARTVVGYAACDGEIDVAGVLDDARLRGASVLLPRRRPGALLELVATPAGSVLARAGGPAAVPEPTGPPIDPATLEAPVVLLAPAIALDRRGGRLGRGGGDYDRLLPALRAPGWTIVGVCHAAQLRELLPVEPHDAPVDVILTDAGVVVPER